jgi:heme-degrading monooxygenase HmoA
MVLELATLDVKPGQEAAFERDFDVAARIIASSAGYIGHDLQRCIEKRNRYILLVRWESLAAHIEGFRKSAPYLEWKKLLHHYYDPFPTVEHYNRVGGAVPNQSSDQTVAPGTSPPGRGQRIVNAGHFNVPQ